MATKSFLASEEFESAKRILRAPLTPPDGDEKKGVDLEAGFFSAHLGERLLARLSRHPRWLEAKPVALGSWARGELSPKSDIDILFCGSEEATREVVATFAREGLKLRSRMPEDPDDWTKGVQSFDVLSLLTAQALAPTAAANLERQKVLLKERNRVIRKECLAAMRAERKARAQRYDSISNYLEPNIKFGPGGLRDLEQALSVRRLFPERFEAAEHAFQVLEYYKSFFLLVRGKLHLSDGGGEVLAAPEQKPIADWLGYQSPQEFMREIQKALSRVSFYSEWVIAQASASAAKLKVVASRQLNTIESLFQALEKDAGILMQNRVRLAADEVFAHTKMSAKLEVLIGKKLTKILDPLTPEEPLLGLFRSRLIDHCIPDFRRIVGYVQHDQYHRFSVDAHLLQVLRELKRLCSKPSRAGRLAPLIRKLSKTEREVLAFSCLYHDLAKGRGGDHSIKGIKIATRDLQRFKKSKAMIQEVAWIVEEHLGLSAAAFRENPRSLRTLNSLADRGVRGRRIDLLAIFTVVDILGTNPEAWTSWKERLLSELVQTLKRPETSELIRFAELLRRAKVPDWERYLEALDPFLMSSVPARRLVDDLKELTHERKKGIDLTPKVELIRGGQQTWIRFHASQDRPGLFLSFVKRLASAGMSIRHASILTDDLLGVYDWFEVKTTKNAQQILKFLALAEPKSGSEKTHRVRFDAIELVASDEREWVISFRGRDQSGALAAAAEALFERGASIKWAKVHTWGRQIDDIFGIAPLSNSNPATLGKTPSAAVGVSLREANGLIENLKVQLGENRQ